ncbi:MAG: hypothetical protein HEQ38_17200 [Gemmatimonas sp.]|nr:hypothetical protein [Gemmatimonas sp.]
MKTPMIDRVIGEPMTLWKLTHEHWVKLADELRAVLAERDVLRTENATLQAARTPTPPRRLREYKGVTYDPKEEVNTADYRNAVSGEGPLAYTWHDKPHRLLYDLCTELDTLAAERDVTERLVSAQHDVLVAMKAFDAAAVEKYAAISAHMHQVHEALGGTDTVLTLEAAQHIVAKLDAAVRERDDADDALAACQAQAAGTIAQLREKLAEAERRALNLLAVVHRDGGQHTSTVGFAESCTEAEAVVVALRKKLGE